MLKAGRRVSDVARYNNCHPSTIQHLSDRYQATVTVNDQRGSGQPRMATVVKTVSYVVCVSTIFTPTISFPASQCQTNSRAPRVICF